MDRRQPIKKNDIIIFESAVTRHDEFIINVNDLKEGENKKIIHESLLMICLIF